MNDLPPVAIPKFLESFLKVAQENGLVSGEQAKQVRDAKRAGKSVAGHIIMDSSGVTVQITISESFQKQLS